MGFIEQIKQAVQSIIKAFEVMRQTKLQWMYLTPLLIYLLLFTAGISLTNHLHTSAMAYFEPWIEGLLEEGQASNMVLQISSVIGWIIIKLGLFFLFAIFSGYIALIFLSPLLTYLSEKIEEYTTGITYDFKFGKFFKDIQRAILVALKNGFKQMLVTALLLLLGFVPVINLLVVPAIFLVGAYYYGFSFFDYNYERKGLSIREGNAEIRRLKFASMTFGALFLFAQMIPWVGTFISIFLVFPLVAGAAIFVGRQSG